MHGDIEIVPIEIPSATYERQMAQLIKALLAIDEKLFNDENAVDLTDREAA